MRGRTFLPPFDVLSVCAVGAVQAGVPAGPSSSSDMAGSVCDKSSKSRSAGVSGGVAPVCGSASVRASCGTLVSSNVGLGDVDEIELGVGGMMGMKARLAWWLEHGVDPMCTEDPSTDRLVGRTMGVGGAVIDVAACLLR